MRTAAAGSVLDRQIVDEYSPGAMGKKTTQAPPPKSGTRDELVRVRVNEAELEAFTAAAGRKGLEVSSWLRMVGRQAAETELGEPIPDIAPRRKQ